MLEKRWVSACVCLKASMHVPFCNCTTFLQALARAAQVPLGAYEDIDMDAYEHADMNASAHVHVYLQQALTRAAQVPLVLNSPVEYQKKAAKLVGYTRSLASRIPTDAYCVCRVCAYINLYVCD